MSNSQQSTKKDKGKKVKVGQKLKIDCNISQNSQGLRTHQDGRNKLNQNQMNKESKSHQKKQEPPIMKNLKPEKSNSIKALSQSKKGNQSSSKNQNVEQDDQDRDKKQHIRRARTRTIDLRVGTKAIGILRINSSLDNPYMSEADSSQDESDSNFTEQKSKSSQHDKKMSRMRQRDQSYQSSRKYPQNLAYHNYLMQKRKQEQKKIWNKKILSDKNQQIKKFSPQKKNEEIIQPSRISIKLHENKQLPQTNFDFNQKNNKNIKKYNMIQPFQSNQQDIKKDSIFAKKEKYLQKLKHRICALQKVCNITLTKHKQLLKKIKNSIRQLQQFLKNSLIHQDIQYINQVLQDIQIQINILESQKTQHQRQKQNLITSYIYQIQTIKNHQAQQRSKYQQRITEQFTSRLKQKTKKQQELQKQNQKMKNTLTCIVCLDKKRDILCLPCRHVVLCLRCSQSISLCPLCRTKMKAVEIFL